MKQIKKADIMDFADIYHRYLDDAGHDGPKEVSYDRLVAAGAKLGITILSPAEAAAVDVGDGKTYNVIAQDDLA